MAEAAAGDEYKPESVVVYKSPIVTPRKPTKASGGGATGALRALAAAPATGRSPSKPAVAKTPKTTALKPAAKTPGGVFGRLAKKLKRK
jgi:hypothetical protein